MAPPHTGPVAESDFVRCVEKLAMRQDAASLVALLDEQNPVYDEQSSRQIVRMRGWILVLLSRGELPAAALPFVLEELDTSFDAYLVAAAALALRALPQPRPEFAPFILKALENIRAHDQPVSFAAYGEYARSTYATTAVQELLGTAIWLGHHGSSLRPRLAALRDGGAVPSRGRGDLDAALRAIDGVGGAVVKEDTCCSFVLGLVRSSWRASERGDVGIVDDTVFQDQNGAICTFRELFHGCPTIVVFFYTRCDNPLKCSLTIWKLARVQRLLGSRGVAGSVRTAAITYDSAFDLPDRLRTFGRNRGLLMDTMNRLLRAVDGIGPLRSHFGLGVSFAANLVNRHRIEVFLLDERGRIARSFQRLRWNEDHLVDEAIALLSDSMWSREQYALSRELRAAGPVAATIVACLPKCPLCWSAYLSSVGLTSLAGRAYPLTLQLMGLLLLVHLASVFGRARATRHWFGFGLSVAGTAAIFTSAWFAADMHLIGIALLGAGALVSALGKRPATWLRNTAAVP